MRMGTQQQQNQIVHFSRLLRVPDVCRSVNIKQACTNFRMIIKLLAWHFSTSFQTILSTQTKNEEGILQLGIPNKADKKDICNMTINEGHIKQKNY